MFKLFLFFLVFTLPQQTMRAEDLKFWGVVGGLQVSSIYDMETTIACSKNPNLREYNSLISPMIPYGRPALYGYQTGVNAGVMLLVHKMRYSSNPVIRRLWWLPPVGIASIHVIVGVHNQSLK
jgi:hypothetical protein